jgi:hypothetical protein
MRLRRLRVALDAVAMLVDVLAADLDAERSGGCTWVRFDWTVFADRRALRVLTPVLRPWFRWNRVWAIARAIEGSSPMPAR